MDRPRYRVSTPISDTGSQWNDAERVFVHFKLRKWPGAEQLASFAPGRVDREVES